MSIYEEIADRAKSVFDRVRGKTESQIADEQRRIEAETDLQEARSLIADPRYQFFKKALQKIEADLQNALNSSLAGDFKSRENRADRAAILAAQISVFKYVRELPENTVKECLRYAK